MWEELAHEYAEVARFSSLRRKFERVYLPDGKPNIVAEADCPLRRAHVFSSRTLRAVQRNRLAPEVYRPPQFGP